MWPAPNPQIPWSEVRKILSPNEQTMALFDEVTRHFGARLRFYDQDPDDRSSSTWPAPGFTEDELEEIQVTIHRQPSAIVHECLHVRLFSRGFPIPIKNIGLDGYTFAAVSNLSNLLHHPIFLYDFLNYKFTRMEFVHDSAIPDDLPKYEAAIDSVINNPNDARYARGAWNCIYLQQLIAECTGSIKQSAEFLLAGKKRFPDTMDADANWLSNWFDRGEFRDPARFGSAVNQVLQHGDLRAARWSRIDPVAGELHLVDVPP
jgi:hypothetical protein